MTSVQSASVASSGSLTRNERLDRLPFNKAHRKLLVASGIGWAFDAMASAWCPSLWRPSRLTRISI